jgi:hypothetical protein
VLFDGNRKLGTDAAWNHKKQYYHTLLARANAKSLAVAASGGCGLGGWLFDDNEFGEARNQEGSISLEFLVAHRSERIDDVLDIR